MSNPTSGPSHSEYRFADDALVDTHCHLDLLQQPVAAALHAARAAGVGAVVTIGIDLASSSRAVESAHEHAGVWASVGLHPHDAARWDEQSCERLATLAQDDRVVAVGECGLDYYRDRSPHDRQREAFVGQMELARRLALPLVVHVREAAEPALDLLAEHAAGLVVIMHCFSMPEYLDECARRGYYCSFAGNVTYKNAGDLRAAVRQVPDELLLLETDAPFLTPVPYRGKENRPERLVHTAALVAEIRGEDGAALARLTTANARRAFRLPDA